ncbi:MAG: MMPL family transporter [Acidobacteriota bacterium]
MLALARIALRYPVQVLGLLALGTALAALGLFRLELRTDGAAIYPANDPVVLRSQADRERFLEPEQVILLVTSRPGGPALQSPAGLRFLLASHREIQRIPEVAMAGVRSIALRMARPRLDGGPLRLHPVVESPVPDDPAAFAALVREIDRALLVRELFLSRDGRSAAIYVHLAAGADRQDLIRGLETWMASRSGSPFRLRLTGPAVAEAELGNAVLRDLQRLVPVMVAAVALLLWISLRTAGGVLVPLLEVLATLVCTLGLMGWTGVPVTLVTTILPVLLMAMSITDEIHLLERVRQRMGDGPLERGRLVKAAADSYADLARPLYLSSLTTAAGFLSFGTASILPLRQFGVFAAIGLVLAMIFSFALVPALIALLPPAWIVRRGAPDEKESALPAWERLVARRSRAAALCGLALLAVAVPGVFLLKVQDSWVDNFDPRSDLVTAERDFNRAFWGSYRFDVVFEGGRLFFQTPRGLALLEDFHRQARTAPHVGGILSPLPPLRMIAETLLDHPGPLSTLPPDGALKAVGMLEAAQKWLDLRQLLTYDHDAARVRLFVRNADFERGRELRGWLQERLPELTARYPVRAHLSGDVPVGLEVVGAIVRNQLRSIGGTLAQIALLLLVVLRSVRRTAVALAPVLAAALLMFAVLGFGGIPLGIATSMFAALTLGAGVDFSLHFVHAYHRERRDGVDHDEAILATLRTGGRGLLWNALVLAFGFSVLAVSAIKPNASLGLLLALAMLVSYGTTLVFLPEILRRVEKG